MSCHQSPLAVLVVDDEGLIRWALGETLRAASHRVVEAGDAACAVRALDGAIRPFDVVVLDFRLPDSSDLGLLARIRRRSPSSAVIMMTASGAEQLRSPALALGASAVVGKPFDLDGMAALVETVSHWRDPSPSRARVH